MGVNIRDIARESGISKSTVSNVLRNKVNVSEKTRKKVLDTIWKLKYDPYKNIPLIQQAKTGFIGYVSPYNASRLDDFLNDGVRAANATISSRGYHCVLYSDSDILKKTTEEFHKGSKNINCDGLIYYCPHQWEESLEVIKSWGIPAVLIRRQTKVKGITTINDDDYKGMQLAMEHLYSLGHRVIGFVGGGSNSLVPLPGRRKGYEDYVREKRLADDLSLIMDDVFMPRFNEIEPQLKGLFSQPEKPTAFVCAGDFFATGLILLLKRMGIRVPADVAVVGYSDSSLAEKFDPQLTSVAVPVEEMMAWACDILVGNIEGTKKEAVEIKVENKLVVRESSNLVLRTEDR